MQPPAAGAGMQRAIQLRPICCGLGKLFVYLQWIRTRKHERTTDTGHQRRRIRLEGTGRRHRSGERIRPRGSGSSRDGTERHEPGHHHVQTAVSAARTPGTGRGGLCLLGHAGRLREDGLRPPAARRTGRPGRVGHQPRLQLGRQRTLLGNDGRRHRGELLRLSGRGPLARRPLARCRLRSGRALWQADHRRPARTAGRNAPLHSSVSSASGSVFTKLPVSQKYSRPLGSSRRKNSSRQ